MSHAGDDLRVDRVGRNPDHITRPALTLAVTTQPDVLDGLFERPGLRERGFMARLLIAVPDSLVGQRSYEPTPMSPQVRESYHVLVHSLLQLPFDCDRSDEITLSPASWEHLKNFSNSLETNLGYGGDFESITEWASKLPGAVARISGIIHCVIHPNRPSDFHVSESTMASAIQVGNYLLSHALSAFDSMSADQSLAGARHVLKWIKRQNAICFTKREAQQAGKRRFRRADDIDEPLAVLIDRRYIKEIDNPKARGPGRPPSQRFQVNPAVFSRSNPPDVVVDTEKGPPDSGPGTVLCGIEFHESAPDSEIVRVVV